MTTTATNKVDVVFLDIDGVLLPFPCDSNGGDCKSGLFPDRTLAALSNILETTRAVLVLSSTWRVRADFREDILTAFRAYGEIFGGPLKEMSDFFEITNVSTHSERQWEIQEWCVANQEHLGAWVALDDEELLEGETNEKYQSKFLGHVVKTESSVGLTMQDAHEAIRLMKEQQKWQR